MRVLRNHQCFQNNKFSEEDIKILVKQFKMEFPTSRPTRPQSLTIIRKVFPRWSLVLQPDILNTSSPGSTPTA